MKILRIIARLNVGGPARHVVWLTERLNDGEFESVLIAGTVPKGEESMGYMAEQHGVRPLFIEEMSRELSPKDLISLFKVLREIRRLQPDIIHTHTAKAGTIGRGAAILYRLITLGRRKVRVVHTFHGHVFHSYYGRLKTGIFITIEKLLARFATDKIVVISPQQFHEIHEEVGVGRRAQFEIIPLGIDLGALAKTANRRNFRRELGIEDSDILVGFVGRLTEIKDVSLYLRVAALVQEGTRQLRMRFAIVGEGHLRQALENEAKTLGMGDSILFLGNRTDMESVYAGLDIVALTSRNEGTPLSLIEAMAARRPVISTIVGGVRDLLGATVEERDGFRVCDRGVGIESRSADEYKKGLIYLAENERLRESLAESGREFVEAEYSKDRLVRDIAQLYRALLAN
ncbi:MAG TPA: glycosyltransferase [Pyrinomonadaceae bacterium]|nr:glycosyltransferase [Pyrinomonadaceae bacterium]